jgi:ParB family chromosome partitioning protein
MEIRELPVNKIIPSVFQPRETFDKEELQELADSMKEHGLINPISVRKNGDGTYQIIAGERRWRAANFAKMDKIYAIVREVTPTKQRLESLIENVHRKDLNNIEKGRGIMEIFGVHNLDMSTNTILRTLHKSENIRRGKSTAKLAVDEKKVLDIMSKIHVPLRLIRTWLESISADEEVIIDHLKTPEKERVADDVIARVSTIKDKELQKKTYAKIKIQDLSSKKASEFVTGIKRLAKDKPKLTKIALESDLDIAFVEQLSEEDEPEVEIPKEEIEEMVQKIKEGEKLSAERIARPIIQERYAHWNNQGVLMSLPNMAEKAFCPFCGKNGSHIRFTCHPDKTAEEILEQAGKNHKDSINRTEVNPIFADIVKARLKELGGAKK